MKGLRSLALGLLLAVPTGAFATDPVVDAGVQLYRYGDFYGAAFTLIQALNHGLRDPNDRKTASLTLAASYEGLGQHDRARGVLAELFREQPTAQVDPRVYPPEFVRFAEAVRKAEIGGGSPATPPVIGPVHPPPPWVRPPWPGPRGFELGLRVAFALPFGNEVDGLSLSDDISSALPFELDLGWRIDPRWYVGVWLAGGPAFVHGDCPPGCSAQVASTGIEGSYHFNPRGFDPWVGLGIGYEYLHRDFVSGGFLVSSHLSGMTFVRAAVGVDFRISTFFTIGPYVDDTVGEYWSISEQGFRFDVTDKSVHSFLQFGARATFNFE